MQFGRAARGLHGANGANSAASAEARRHPPPPPRPCLPSECARSPVPLLFHSDVLFGKGISRGPRIAGARARRTRRSCAPRPARRALPPFSSRHAPSSPREPRLTGYGVIVNAQARALHNISNGGRAATDAACATREPRGTLARPPCPPSSRAETSQTEAPSASASMLVHCGDPSRPLFWRCVRSAASLRLAMARKRARASDGSCPILGADQIPTQAPRRPRPPTLLLAEVSRS